MWHVLSNRNIVLRWLAKTVGSLLLRLLLLLLFAWVVQVLVGTPNGAFGATVPPEWVREEAWRKDVKQLLDKTEDLNTSQKR